MKTLPAFAPALAGDGPRPGDRDRAAAVRHPIAIERIDPDAVQVLRRLVRAGHVAYLVGGGVRDLLLGRAPKDFDVGTSARPLQVRALFRNCRIIGRRFRLAHVFFRDGKVIEVATFRRDPSSRSEHDEGTGRDLLIRSDNVYGEPHEDAARRDFTINGLFYDIEREQVIDHVGGLLDVQRRLLRTIGDPDVRLREDPVRILRAIKFAARLDLGIDPALYDAMVEHRGQLVRAAPARVLEEILRLLRGGAAHRSVALAWDTGALSVVLPEVASFLDDDAEGASLLWARLGACDRRQRAGRLPSDPVLLLALLSGALEEALHEARDPAAALDGFFEPLVRRLVLPRRMRERIRQVLYAQRRLATGRHAAIAGRDFYDDAVTWFCIEREARGQPVPEWARASPSRDASVRRDATRPAAG